MSESIFTREGYIRPAVLIAAYRGGMFPMAMDNRGEIGWFSPDPRGVIHLDEFHIPKSLARTIKKEPFEIRIDTAFSEVMRGCSDRRTTWISREIITSYEKLFELGYAHSVECWKDDELVGGLYGIAIGGAFFGESMFHQLPEASKVCMNKLIEIALTYGVEFIDCQVNNPFLKSLGAREVPRTVFLRQLENATKQSQSVINWDELAASSN